MCAVHLLSFLLFLAFDSRNMTVMQSYMKAKKKSIPFDQLLKLPQIFNIMSFVSWEASSRLLFPLFIELAIVMPRSHEQRTRNVQASIYSNINFFLRLCSDRPQFVNELELHFQIVENQLVCLNCCCFYIHCRLRWTRSTLMWNVFKINERLRNIYVF